MSASDPVLPHASRPAVRWLGIALALLVALCFAPALRGSFVYDDRLMIERNPILASFANLPRAFSGAYWDFLDADSASRIGYWRPLTAVALMCGRALGGGSPLAFHALSIAVHAAAAVAAFALLLRLRCETWLAWLGACLWALHPVHVESVAWITALNDPLFGVCVLLALERHVAWTERGVGRPWAAGAWLALGMLSKELAAVVVPCAIALDLARARPIGAVSTTSRADGRVGSARTLGALRGERGLLARLAHWKRAWLPYALVFAAYWAARALVFGSVYAGFDRTTTSFGFSAARMALLRVELFGGGLGLLVWPAELALFRMVPPSFDWSSSEAWIALTAFALWCIAAAIACVRRAWPLLGWLLFSAAAMAPMLLRIESLGQFPLSDRFLYMPALGVVGALVVWCGAWRSVALARGVLIALVVAAAARAWQRIPAWRNEPALFEAAVHDSPRSAYAWWGEGRVQLDAYLRERDTSSLSRALQAFERAQDLCDRALHGDPAIFATRADVLQSNLGVGFCLLYEAEIDDFHDWETPKRLFENVAKLRPDSEMPLIGLALVESQLGDKAEAERLLTRALALNPRSAEAQRNLGVISMSQAKWDAARRAFEASLALRPGNLDDRVWIARALFQDGWTERAEEIAEAARVDYPDSAAPLVVLAALARARGDGSRALGLLDEALRADPRNAFAHHTRGQVLYEAEQNAAAIEAFRRACELDTTNFEYHYNLGALLLQTGARDAAVPYLKRAYEVGGGRPQLEALRELFATQVTLDAHDYFALARADHGRDERDVARTWVERAVALDSQFVEARYLRGLLMKLSGDREGAVAEFRWLADRAPEQLEFWIELGGLLLALRQGKQAIPVYEHALELVPKQPKLDAKQRELLRDKLAAELASARAM